MWGRSMATTSCDCQVKLIRSRQQWARADRKFTHRKERHIVHAIDLINAPTLHQAVLAHLKATAAALFRRLEDHHRCSVKIAGLCQILRSAQQHRRMTVMATGMHLAGDRAGVFQPRLFMDRQRIHVSAQANHPT